MRLLFEHAAAGLTSSPSRSRSPRLRATGRGWGVSGDDLARDVEAEG
jgi:hypothetical protein